MTYAGGERILCFERISQLQSATRQCPPMRGIAVDFRAVADANESLVVEDWSPACRFRQSFPTSRELPDVVPFPNRSAKDDASITGIKILE